MHIGIERKLCRIMLDIPITNNFKSSCILIKLLKKLMLKYVATNVGMVSLQDNTNMVLVWNVWENSIAQAVAW